MTIIAWWSRRTDEICLSLDDATAGAIEGAVTQVVAVTYVPALAQFLDGLRHARRERAGALSAGSSPQNKGES